MKTIENFTLNIKDSKLKVERSICCGKLELSVRFHNGGTVGTRIVCGYNHARSSSSTEKFSEPQPISITAWCLRFPRRYLWSSLSSGMWRRIAWKIFSTVSEKSYVTIFRYKSKPRGKGSYIVWHDVTLCGGVGVFFFSLALQPPWAQASSFSFMIILQTVGLLGRVISSSHFLDLGTS
jgi:hypothetical protein